jgi:hypothetical protein
MTSDEFAALSASLAPGARRKLVLDAVQFQLGGKTFATIGWPEPGWAAVKVDPRRQAKILRLGDGLAPEPGRRRKAGIVLLRLAMIDAQCATLLLLEAVGHAHGASQRGRPSAGQDAPDRLARVAA